MKRSRNALTILIIMLCAVCIFAGCGLFDSDDKAISISQCQITLDQEVYQYTGEAIMPEVLVKYNGNVLQKDKDYTLAYENNVNVGIGTIKVIGKGNYDDEKTIQFEIAENVYTYVFKCNYPDSCKFVGKTVQSVKDKTDLVPPVADARGYTFKSWYVLPGRLVDFNDPDTLPSSGGEFYALFELNNYSLTYHLDGGNNNSENPSSYTIESDFELLSPKKDGEFFAGWYLDENYTERIERISPGRTGNIDLYAKFVSDEYRKINYVVPDGVDFAGYEYYAPSAKLTKPDIVSEDGSRELVWYEDSNYTVRYVFRTMHDKDITVYSRWEDVLDAGFLDSLPDGSIDSYDELLDYVEYICYNNIQTRDNFVNITYISGITKIKNEISKAAKECNYPRVGTLSYSSTNTAACIYLAEDLTEYEGKLSGTPEEQRYKQYQSVFYNPTSERSEDYDDFAINYVEDTYECTTSNQLFYILSHGYRPLPVAGSQAQIVYDEYKAIMRSIVDDGMTDYEKVKTIYEWLIVNVYYDNYVAYELDGTHQYYEYKAFYLEGVLEGSAVCDGISKAFSVMCAIEGIDCVRVTGQIENANVGHAWNKVQVMGDWYLSDATWGNQTFGTTEEYLMYEYLLFTDEERLEDGYQSNNYTEYDTADNYSKVDIFDNIEVVVEETTADMLIDSAEELSYVLEYVYYYNAVDEAGRTLDMMIAQSTDISSMVSKAYQLLRQRRPSSVIYKMPTMFAYGSQNVNNEYPAGTKFVFIFP